MPQEREAIVLAKTPGKSEAEIKEEGKRIADTERAALKAKLAAAYDRGLVDHRLTVTNLPDDLYGEWIRNNSIDIDAMRALGFEIDRTYAVKRAIHDEGAEAAIVGDVIFMTCPRYVKEVIEEIKQDKKNAAYRKKSREEQEYEANVQADTDGIIPTTTESTIQQVGAQDISEALDALERQRIVSSGG